MRFSKMEPDTRVQKNCLKAAYGNERGIVLAVVLMFLVILGAMGSAAVMKTRGAIKISDNYKDSEEMFYAAQAGTEHAREVLREINATSTDSSSFTDELATASGSNGILDGYVSGSDDLPIINATLGNGTYTVYLTNDLTDGYSNAIDTNKTVMFTSVASGPQGHEAVIETTVSAYEFFNFPGAITLLGEGANFAGGNSNAKELHGDDQCATPVVFPAKPVVAISSILPMDLLGVQSNINGSKPDTYYTKDELGLDVTASSRPDLIASVIPTSMLLVIQNNYGINLLDPNDLDALVTMLMGISFATVAPGGSSAGTVNVGTPGDPKVVVVNGNFDLNGNGAGILVVIGQLTFRGNVNYDGIVLVIGEGYMKRNGGGNGTISGGILVANTANLTPGPDGIPGNADDELGPPTFDTSGGGNSNVQYCSTAIDDVVAGLPLKVKAFRHLM